MVLTKFCTILYCSYTVDIRKKGGILEKVSSKRNVESSETFSTPNLKEPSWSKVHWNGNIGLETLTNLDPLSWRRDFLERYSLPERHFSYLCFTPLKTYCWAALTLPVISLSSYYFRKISNDNSEAVFLVMRDPFMNKLWAT